MNQIFKMKEQFIKLKWMIHIKIFYQGILE